MATNGASARQWLADKGQSASPQELQRIRSAIAGKLDVLAEDHPDEDGLLEALDVIDNWIEHGKASENSVLQTSSLDTSPLVPDLPRPKRCPAMKRTSAFASFYRKAIYHPENKTCPLR